jgi:uncharacterized protein (TIGR02266 family)
MEEARKDKRVSAEFPVRVKSATVGEFVDRLAADVSLGGIFIQAEPPLDVGTLVRVEFHVDDGTQLCTGVGRVVWNRGEDVATPERPVGMGVKFVRVDTATKDVLSSFVERRASEVSIERRVVVLPESTLSQRPPPEPEEEVAAPAAPAIEADAESRDSALDSSTGEGPAEARADVSSLAALDARSPAAEEEQEAEDDEEDETAADDEEAAAGASDDEDEDEEEDEEEEETAAPAAAATPAATKAQQAPENASQAESRRSKKRGKKARKEEARQRKREQKQAAAEVARKEQTEKPKPAKERPSRPQELPVAQPQSGSRSMLPIIVIVAIIIAIVLGVYFYSSSQSGGDGGPGQESSAD